MSITDKRNKPRPAIETDPLPQAGESLHRAVIDLVFGRAMMVSIIFAVIAWSAAMEWYRYAFHLPPTRGSAIVYTVIAGIVGVIAFIMLRRMFPRARALQLGLRGERHVGHYLDDICRSIHYRVLHDIPGSNGDFNVDHVLIGPGGIFAIETKNWTKPEGFPNITVEGDSLVKLDGSFDTHAIAQAKANADFIRKCLAKLTAREARSFAVQPVLVLPGWFIEPLDRHAAVWVVPNDLLHRWLSDAPRRLSAADVALFYESLATYSRNSRR